MWNIKKDKDNIITLEINDEKNAVNLLNSEFQETFLTTLKKIFSEDIKGLIITSGKKDFIAGGDLKLLQALETKEEARTSIKKVLDAFQFLETQGKPVVAALNGSALGGGLELALSCHYRVCINNSKIKLGFPEVTFGLLPGAGGTQRLPRILGIQPALELLTLGTSVGPEKAHKLGLVNELVDSREKLLDTAKNFILKTPQIFQLWYDKKFKIPGGGVQTPQGYQVFAASNAMVAEKTFNNYPAPKAILSCVYEGLQLPFEEGIKIETRYFVELVTGQVSKNMIKTLFFGIGECNKGAARPKNIPLNPTKKLGVLGAGMMGSGIAYVAAASGIQVILKDISVENAKKGKDYSDKIATTLVEKNRLKSDDKLKILELIQVTDDPNAVADCDLVIETVIEDRKIKAAVTKESENVISPKSIMASNTSTLPITGLAQASKRPEQFIGLHFFSPVDKMPLLEIIMGEKTKDEALAKAIDFAQQIRKTPIVVNDGRGFYTSRVFMTYVFEGISLLQDGVAPTLIENAGKMIGMPVGPLAVADEVSIDLIYHVLKQTSEDLGDDKVDKGAFEVSKLFVEKLKRLGRKSKGGFYEYPTTSKKYLWPNLVELFPTSKIQPTIQEIKNRLLSIQVLEAIHCLEEKILRSKRDGDVGSILGWGFPAYTGGALSYITMVGPDKFISQCESLAKTFGVRFQSPKNFILETFSK